MNREQQYRTGRFNRPDPNAQWVRAEVIGILEAPDDAVRGDDDRTPHGWPRAWSTAFVDLWQRCYGTTGSARAWQRAGWVPEEVLTAHVIVSGTYVPVLARVSMLQPPRRESIRCRSIVDGSARRNRSTVSGGNA